jgi:hypothetical protein
MKKFYGIFDGKNSRSVCSGKMPNLFYLGLGMITGCIVMRSIVFFILGL